MTPATVMLAPKYLKALGQITTADRVLIVTHDRPDGDALAAMCAIIELMQLLEKDCLPFCHDIPPPQFGFLPHIDKIITDKKLLDVGQFDVIIVLDCGQLSRTSLTEEIQARRKDQFVIEFDHHPKVHDYANLEIRNPKASSTVEIIFDFLRTNLVRINKNLATCILTGILTDTGNLLYDATTDKTIKIASDMLLYGARFPLIMENTWRNKSIGGMKIWGIAMHRLYLNKRFNMAITVLSRDDFRETGATDEEMEGVPGFLSNISDADAILVLREMDDGKIKGSLRSMNPKIDISKLARELGGGGHPRASAFVLDAKLVKSKDGWDII